MADETTGQEVEEPTTGQAADEPTAGQVANGQTPSEVDSLQMMEQAMRYVNNRFDRRADGSEVGAVSGSISVSGGSIDIDGLADGQWFWVEGSSMNDGLWRYPADSMADEEFGGSVVFLAVPRAFASLCAEMAEWDAEHAAVNSSPLQSESFGGYSYTKASGGASGNETPAAAWQLQFGARLRPFRKLSRDWA